MQKYKRVLYSTSTVHEEYKDMLYSGSTDSSTGSTTVVVQGSKLFCAGTTVAQGYCGTIEACPPCSPGTEDDEYRGRRVSPQQRLYPWLVVCRRGCTTRVMDYVVLDAKCRSRA